MFYSKHSKKLISWITAFLAGIFLCLWPAPNTSSQNLSTEDIESWGKTEIFNCTQIPYGEHLYKTKLQLEEFLPKLVDFSKQSRQVFLNGKKLANFSQECNSANCGASCSCPIFGGLRCCAEKAECQQAYNDALNACMTACAPLPLTCIVCPEVAKWECIAKPGCKGCRYCLTDAPTCLKRVWGIQVAHPCAPKTRDLLTLGGFLIGDEYDPIKDEYDKAKTSSQKIPDLLKNIVLMEEELDTLINATDRLKEQFAFWYRERNTYVSLFDCPTVRDMHTEEGPTECPFGGLDYYYCK